MGDHNQIQRGQMRSTASKPDNTSVANLTLGRPGLPVSPRPLPADTRSTIVPWAFCTAPIMLDTKHSPGACRMSEMRFADVMQRERERLNRERGEDLQ